MVEELEKTTEQQIVEHLENNGQKLSWLAKQIGKSPSHLYLVLKGNKDNKRDLSESNRKKINEILKTNF